MAMAVAEHDHRDGRWCTDNRPEHLKWPASSTRVGGEDGGQRGAETATWTGRRRTTVDGAAAAKTTVTNTSGHIRTHDRCAFWLSPTCPPAAVVTAAARSRWRLARTRGILASGLSSELLP